MIRLKIAYLIYWTVASALLGVLVAPLVTSTMPTDHSTHYTHDHSMAHGKIEVDPGVVPSVDIEVVKDVQSGWNVHLDVKNFKFTPRNVNLAHVPNEGHAHLYVDGVKLTRLYASSYHLAALPQGEHVVSVSLNANDHSELVLQGTPISASTTLTETDPK